MGKIEPARVTGSVTRVYNYELIISEKVAQAIYSCVNQLLKQFCTSQAKLSMLAKEA